MWIGADLNSDNLQISKAYLRITDHCRVTVRVGVRVRIRVWVTVRFANCCIQTAGESDKMRINHGIKTDQWHATPQIHPIGILSCPRIYSLVITIKVSLVPMLRVGQSNSLAVTGIWVKIRGFQPQAS